MKTSMKTFAMAVLSLFLLTNCMESKGENQDTSTSDPAYNEDTRTPEPIDSGGNEEQTHIPNTGPDNDSDSMQ